MPDTPLRGRRGRDRRIAERVATDFAARHSAPPPEAERDFDVAAVDAEVEDARRPAPAPRPVAPRPAKPATPARAGGGHRLPDLSGLPPLLAATGTFAALRERLGTTDDDPRRAGRHVGLVAVPHGAKSYLAAALALGADGERLVWIARDAEIGDRVAEELGAWLGDVEAVAVLEPRTALAYERSELIADETAARVAALAAWRSGRARVLVASVQALLQHTIDPGDLPTAPRELRLGSRIHQDALLRELFDLGYVPVSEVAGRGESARRGGIVDVFPPSLPLPIRIEFFGDEIDSLRSFDPTDQRTVGALESAVLLPASEFLLPDGGAGAIRDRLGRSAARLPERLAADLARFDGEPLAQAPGADADASRAMAVGDAAEVWAAHLAPATGLDHVAPGTLLVLDEPGDIAEAAGFLWRQADERRTELVAAGRAAQGLAVDLSPAARLEGPPRRVADPRADLGVRAARGRRDGPRRAVVGRPVRLARAGPARRPGRAPGRGRRGLAGGWRPDRPRLGPGAASRRRPRRGRSPGRGRRSGRGAATARRDRPHRAQPQRRLHRRSGRSRLRHRPRAVRDGPDPAPARPSGGSCRATSSSA